MSETHKQVIVIRKDLKMRLGKSVSQGAHASMKVLLDCAWPADQIHATGNSPRIAALTNYIDAPGWLSGNYKCIPNGEDIRPWLDGKFTKICVGVDSEAELLEIHNRAKETGILTALIQDAGLTEFKGIPTFTSTSIGPGKNEDIDKITGHLKLL